MDNNKSKMFVGLYSNRNSDMINILRNIIMPKKSLSLDDRNLFE